MLHQSNQKPFCGSVTESNITIRIVHVLYEKCGRLGQFMREPRLGGSLVSDRNLSVASLIIINGYCYNKVVSVCTPQDPVRLQPVIVMAW